MAFVNTLMKACPRFQGFVAFQIFPRLPEVLKSHPCMPYAFVSFCLTVMISVEYAKPLEPYCSTIKSQSISLRCLNVVGIAACDPCDHQEASPKTPSFQYAITSPQKCQNCCNLQFAIVGSRKKNLHILASFILFHSFTLPILKVAEYESLWSRFSVLSVWRCYFVVLSPSSLKLNPLRFMTEVSTSYANRGLAPSEMPSELFTLSFCPPASEWQLTKCRCLGDKGEQLQSKHKNHEVDERSTRVDER